jgi:hypothetical protein
MTSILAVQRRSGLPVSAREDMKPAFDRLLSCEEAARLLATSPRFPAA